ncbi:MAG UNVERIFIED_CONTAM: hypothetical protein LVR18_17930 [Planctomycetaceae bacterium]
MTSTARLAGSGREFPRIASHSSISATQQSQRLPSIPRQTLTLAGPSRPPVTIAADFANGANVTNPLPTSLGPVPLAPAIFELIFTAF